MIATADNELQLLVVLMMLPLFAICFAVWVIATRLQLLTDEVKRIADVLDRNEVDGKERKA